MSLNKHKFVFRSGTDVVIVTTNEVTCTEVVRSVYYYLLGCSFAKENVLDAMAQIVDEHERDKDHE